MEQIRQIIPPLNVSEREIKTGLNIIEATLGEL
jgi:4-aminobutyrate aminotransferase-like enzyme